MSDKLYRDRLARVALSLIAPPNHPTLARIAHQSGAAAALAHALTLTLPPRRVLAHPIPAPDATAVAEALIHRAERHHARVLVPADGEWPARLTGTLAPWCLWATGQTRLAEACRVSVALVGTRAPTAYGRHVAADLAYGLTQRGITVATLTGGGIAERALTGARFAHTDNPHAPAPVVIAPAADTPQPDSTTTISPYPPGATPPPDERLALGTLLAAVTTGTCLIEAPDRGHALDTAHTAHDLGRATWAIPGPVTSQLSYGPHLLARTRDGVRLATTATDITNDLTHHKTS